jgi:phage recombination protein Bet
MTTELTTVNSLMSLAEIPREHVKREMDRNYLSNLVRQHPSLDKRDFIDFINKCQLTGADPRLNQVYLLVHNAYSSETGKSEPKGTTIFSYQFLIQTAQKTGELEGFGVDTVVDTYTDFATGQEKRSLTSTAWVNRKNAGRYEYKARFWEFAKTMRDGKLMGNWKTAPYLMLEKCAVANVMRWAFPESLAGVYISEEMTKDGSQSMVEPVVQPVAEKPIEISDKKTKSTQDYKDEMLAVLESADDSFFEKIGKTREFMLEKVHAEKTYEGIKSKYDILTSMMTQGGQ